MRPTLLMFALIANLLTACGDDPGARRLAEEPWRAWVSLAESGVRVRLEYEPEDGGPRARTLEDGGRLPWPAGVASLDVDAVKEMPAGGFPRVATVLELPLDRSWNRTLRRLPTDGQARMARLFLAAGEGSGALSVFPFLVPAHHAEREIARLGQALLPQDIARGLTTESVIDLRITREKGQVRYQWEQSRIERREPSAPGDEVTLTDAQVRAKGRGPLLPGLARMLKARTEFESGVRVAAVLLYATDEVLCIDALRAVECAKADPAVLFLPYPEPWGWNERDEYRHSIRVPRTTDELEPASWFSGSGPDRRPVRQLLLAADGSPGWRFWPATPEQVVKEFDRIGRDAKRRIRRVSFVVLRLDGRCPWPQALPWIQRAEAGEVELRLRFMTGDHGIDSETELRLPARRESTPTLVLGLAEVPDRIADVRGRIVKLTSPDTATVNDVWRAALALMTAGATGIDFE